MANNYNDKFGKIYFQFIKINNVDAWDIYYHHNRRDVKSTIPYKIVGCATCLSDGYKATVKFGNFEKTVSANSFSGLYDKAGDAFLELIKQTDDFTDFQNDWEASLNYAGYIFSSDEYWEYEEGKAEYEADKKAEEHWENQGVSIAHLEAHDRFWGAEAYDI